MLGDPVAQLLGIDLAACFAANHTKTETYIGENENGDIGQPAIQGRLPQLGLLDVSKWISANARVSTQQRIDRHIEDHQSGPSISVMVRAAANDGLPAGKSDDSMETTVRVDGIKGAGSGFISR